MLFAGADALTEDAPPRRSPIIGATALFVSRCLALSLCISFSILLIYTIQTDGSPFRSELLTPWMSTTLVDYYLTALPFYIIIFLRSSTLLEGVLWPIACACLGSSTVWLYVFVTLMRVRPGVSVAALLCGSAWG